MAKEFIAAIELGSAKITGIAGRKNPDGSLSVLSVVREDATPSIRKGLVYNIDKTVQSVNNIVKKLENNLKTKVARVYVGVSGQGIHSVRNVVGQDLPADMVVTVDMVDAMRDANRSMAYSDMEILDSVTQEYRVGNQYHSDPVGIQAQRVEGNFLNILWRKKSYRNLNKCFAEAGIPIAEMYLAPLALAESVLTETEMRSGCVLVDMGAETTTVSVYFKSILRHLAVIPLGSHNITKDIASLQIDDKEAEEIKIKHTKAYTNMAEIDPRSNLTTSGGVVVDLRTLAEVVEARVEEIVQNVWSQVPGEYMGKLLGGIVITGGGSNMENMDKAFKNCTQMAKVRVARFVNTQVSSSVPGVMAMDATMNTAIALLSKGDMNCAGEDITGDLFSSAAQAGGKAASEREHTAQQQGKVQTEEEKKRAEELAAEQRAEQEEKERLERERIERERRENSWKNKTWKALKTFGRKIVEADE